MLDEVEELVGITPLVVVPCDKLYEVLIEAYAGICIEYAGAGIGIEVGGNYFVFRVADYTLELFTLGCSLHSGLDFLVGCTLLDAAGEVYHRYVGRGNAERHAGELTVEARNYLADCLCGACRAGYDVVCRRTTAAPVLL